MLHQKQYKILLIGDSCIDQYFYGNCYRKNPENDSPLLNIEYKVVCDGMCLNVRDNLLAFENVSISVLTNEIKSVKQRFIDCTTGLQLLRVDQDIKNEALKLSSIHNIEMFDIVLISDYNKGYIDEDFIYDITDLYPCPIFIDSKKHRLPKNNCFIKINESEYNKLLDKEKHQNVIVTIGSKGAKYNNKIFSTEMVQSPNVIGAGDTFFAMLGYHYMITMDICESIVMANAAANRAVKNEGTYNLSREDVNILYRHR